MGDGVKAGQSGQAMNDARPKMMTCCGEGLVPNADFYGKAEFIRFSVRLC